jgi:AcrR family transcriptional regulator
MGLRELKKEQTRRLLAETAWRLFADRGFDQVTVGEVARHAQVAVATVFNYFPTKEDLFYYRLEAFGARLVDAISSRTEGEPALVAFRRHLLESGGLLAQVEAGDPQALERLWTVNRVIAASPALRDRKQRGLGQRGFALLEHGLGDYATRPARSTLAPTATRNSRTTEAEGAR